MFSGKTTELHRLIHREESIGRRVLVINHSFDKERADDMVTHAGHSMKCISLKTLKELESPSSGVDFRKYDAIAINEGQFFDDLEEVVKIFLVRYNKAVFVSALDSDFTMKPFMNVMSLIPHADKVMKLQALCMGKTCRDGTPALYSCRKTREVDTIVVGGADKYMPLCCSCYFKQNSSAINSVGDLYRFRGQHRFTEAFIERGKEHYGNNGIKEHWETCINELRRMEDDLLEFNTNTVSKRNIEIYSTDEMDGPIEIQIKLFNETQNVNYTFDVSSILNKFKLKMLIYYFPKEITSESVKEFMEQSFYQ